MWGMPPQAELGGAQTSASQPRARTGCRGWQHPAHPHPESRARAPSGPQGAARGRDPLTSNGHPALHSTAIAAAEFAARAVLIRRAEVAALGAGGPPGRRALAKLPWEGEGGRLQQAGRAPSPGTAPQAGPCSQQQLTGQISCCPWHPVPSSGAGTRGDARRPLETPLLWEPLEVLQTRHPPVFQHCSTCPTSWLRGLEQVFPLCQQWGQPGLDAVTPALTPRPRPERGARGRGATR